MSSLHCIETKKNSGGGVPRVAQIIGKFFSDDCVLPVNDLGFLGALKCGLNYCRNRTNFNCVFIHNVYSARAVLLGVIISFFFRKRLFISAHGATNVNLINKSRKKKIYLAIFVWVMKLFVYRYHFLNSGELSDSYLKNKIDGKYVLFSYPVLLPGDFKYSPRVYDESRLRVGFYSRIESRKGIFNLIKAISEVRSEGFDVRLVVFGPVEDNEFYEIMKYNEFINYGGLVSLGEYIVAASDIDVFCLPSFGEANSLALLENIMIGVPCLVSRQSNPPVVDGVHVYGDFDDIKALKEGIVKYFSIDVRVDAARSNIDFSANYNERSINEILRVTLN